MNMNKIKNLKFKCILEMTNIRICDKKMNKYDLVHFSSSALPDFLGIGIFLSLHQTQFVLLGATSFTAITFFRFSLVSIVQPKFAMFEYI